MSTGKKTRNPITAFCWISFTVQATFSLSRLLLIPVSHKVVCLCFGFKYQKTSTFFLSGKKAGAAVCLVFLSRVLPSGIRGTTGEGRNTGSVLCFTPMSCLARPSCMQKAQIAHTRKGAGTHPRALYWSCHTSNFKSDHDKAVCAVALMVVLRGGASP